MCIYIYIHIYIYIYKTYIYIYIHTHMLAVFTAAGAELLARAFWPPA